MPGFICRIGISTLFDSRSLLLALAKATILYVLQLCLPAIGRDGLELVESFLPSSNLGALSNGDTSAELDCKLAMSPWGRPNCIGQSALTAFANTEVHEGNAKTSGTLLRFLYKFDD